MNEETSRAEPGPAVRVPIVVTILAVLFLGIFASGYAGQLRSAGQALTPAAIVLAAAAPLALVAGVVAGRRRVWRERLGAILDEHTRAIDARPDREVGVLIARAAGVGIFLELAMIRIHSSTFLLFAYYRNVSLLACFLGLGIGYTLARRRLATPLVLPLVAFQVLALHVLRYQNVGRLLQNPVPEVRFIGLDQAREIFHLATAYGFLALFFLLAALAFVPLGQLAGRLMDRRPRLVAYGWNLAGSVAGIVVFGFLAYAWTPPGIWLFVGAVVVLSFLHEERRGLLAGGFSIALVLAMLAVPPPREHIEVYSPYQVLDLRLDRDTPPILSVNNMFFQRMFDLSRPNPSYEPIWSDHYALPYLLQPRPADVLVVGSGTGNDVAAAVRHGAGRVDAVEIDPAILEFGRDLHPARPYQAPNVRATVDDARNFIRRTDRRYDLIVYGLLDSHTLLSGHSSVRLDSFVYTVEAFAEARDRLKPGGVVVLNFCLGTTGMGRKIYAMLEGAHGSPPRVWFTEHDTGFAFVVGPSVAGVELPERYREVTDRFRDPSVEADPSTDDWPFLYMAVRGYPRSYAVVVLLLVAVSIATIAGLGGLARGAGFSLPCFFLGAGFMLIETKGITELALVFGTTWVVTSAVVLGILAMAFAANLYVLKIGIPRALPAYALLVGAILAGLAVRPAAFGDAPAWIVRAAMTGALTLPVFFSGLAFSGELARDASARSALSANLLGAMAGGFLESSAMSFGYRSLYFLAIGLYVLAFLTRRRGA